MEISAIRSDENELEKLAKSYGKTKRKRWYHHLAKHFLPSHMEINLHITRLLVLLFFCLFMFGMLQENVLPGSEIFSLFLLGILAFVCGKVIELTKLPALLGMMIGGFLYRNLDVFPYYDDLSQKTAAAVREIALSFILLRAGLELDGNKLKMMKFAVFRLTIVPCLVETVSIGVFSHFLLELPWVFSVMLGFVISAVSPAVILPIVIYLERKGYGLQKGIPTLIIAATSLDDILAIAGFTVCFSIAFSRSDLAWTLIKGPLEPLVGLAFGSVLGVIFWHFPSSSTRKGVRVYYNVLLVSLGCITAMFFSDFLSIPGAGPLSCITLSFVAALSWRGDDYQFEGVQTCMAYVWALIEPFLFALIGAEVTLETLKASADWGSLTLFLGLVCRGIGTLLACFGTGLNLKEKLFMCCIWIPKATVQAAVGSQALDYARLHHQDPELLQYGTTVLNISVLSIFLTAPLGAILGSLTGPVLLTKDGSSQIDEEETSPVTNQPDYGAIEPSTAELVPKERV